MKKNHIRSAVAAAVLTIGAAGAANALVLTTGAYKFTIDNFDSGTTGYGDSVGLKCASTAQCDAVPGITPAPGSVGSSVPSADTTGIFSVALITDTRTNQTVFTKGVDGYLTGIFGGITDNNVSVFTDPANGRLTTVANAVNGSFSLYENTVDYNPALGPAPGAGKDLNNNLYPGINSANLFLQGIFVPGVLAGDFGTTYQSIFANTGFAGNGSGFIDLTGGSALATFNTAGVLDQNGVGRDLSLTTTFDDVNGAARNNGYTVVSAGQLQNGPGRVTPPPGQIPEPGSLALLAMGGLVAGMAARRRKPVIK